MVGRVKVFHDIWKDAILCTLLKKIQQDNPAIFRLVRIISNGLNIIDAGMLTILSKDFGPALTQCRFQPVISVQQALLQV